MYSKYVDVFLFSPTQSLALPVNWSSLCARVHIDRLRLFYFREIYLRQRKRLQETCLAEKQRNFRKWQIKCLLSGEWDSERCLYVCACEINFACFSRAQRPKNTHRQTPFLCNYHWCCLCMRAISARFRFFEFNIISHWFFGIFFSFSSFVWTVLDQHNGAYIVQNLCRKSNRFFPLWELLKINKGKCEERDVWFKWIWFVCLPFLSCIYLNLFQFAKENMFCVYIWKAF